MCVGVRGGVPRWGNEGGSDRGRPAKRPQCLDPGNVLNKILILCQLDERPIAQQRSDNPYFVQYVKDPRRLLTRKKTREERPSGAGARGLVRPSGAEKRPAKNDRAEQGRAV